MFLEMLPQDLQQVIKEYKELLDQLPPVKAAERVASYVPRMTQKMAAKKARETGGSPADYFREAEIVAGKADVHFCRRSLVRRHRKSYKRSGMISNAKSGSLRRQAPHNHRATSRRTI